MRLQDELVALFEIADTPTRRYILGQVERLPVHFDATELAGLLERGMSDPERLVSARAAVAWDRIGPRLVLHGYGLDPGRMGVWSMLAAQVAGQELAPASAGTPIDAAAQRASLAAVLEPCRASLLALAGRAGIAGEHARQILALVPLAQAEDTLIDGVRDPARMTGALLALARRDPKLALSTARDVGRVPGWLRATLGGAVGGKAGLALALDAARSGDATACWAAAESLPELAKEAWPDLARTLVDRASGWGPAALADALGQLPATGAPGADPEPLKLLDEVLKKAGHDLVRILAVKAMGGFPGDRSRRRAMKCLDLGSPLLQAAAIECLARLDHRPPELPGALAQRAASGPLKLRGTAILGLMTFDPMAALTHALGLVQADDPSSRVEGAFALGYLKSRSVVKLLKMIAGGDPFVPAALQALKSLAHFPGEQAGPSLVELLAHAEPAVAHTALRVLAHYPHDAPPGVLAAIESLEKASARDAAPGVLRECGLLGFTVPDLAEYLARPRRDPALRAAALEGLVRSGEVPPELARSAAAETEPNLSIPGALAQLVAGDEAGAAVLARWLTVESAVPAAVRALRDLAVIAGEAGHGGRHTRLARLLARRVTGQARSLKSGTSAASRAVPRPAAAAPPARASDAPPAVAALAAPPPPAVAAPSPVAPRPATPAPAAARGTENDAPSIATRAAVDGLAGALAQLAARPAAKHKRDWAAELTYLHGPSSFFETYRALLPAAAIVLAIVLFFTWHTAVNVVAPEASPVVRRDALLGKTGDPVELTGKIIEVQSKRSALLVQKAPGVLVRVWLPGVDVSTHKVGAEVTVRGTVKDLRSEPIVVHGFAVKDS